MSQVPLYMQSGCYALTPEVQTPYDYEPWLAAGIAFVACFAVTGLLHIAQSVYTRQWFGFLFVVGALVEVIGWAGRLWSAKCPYNNNAFLMQISTLIIAPTFFTAGIYVILGRLISHVGLHSSPLTPKWYLWIFCSCDFLSLVVQAAGGGLASDASSKPNGDTKPGTDIMVAGILFQMASITIFTVLLVIFLLRVRHEKFHRNLKLLVGAMIFSVVMIYIRSAYRSVELLQGWSGYLITHQIYFIVLDGGLMVLAVAIFNLLNPGWLLNSVSGGMAAPDTELVTMVTRPPGEAKMSGAFLHRIRGAVSRRHSRTKV